MALKMPVTQQVCTVTVPTVTDVQDHGSPATKNAGEPVFISRIKRGPLLVLVSKAFGCSIILREGRSVRGAAVMLREPGQLIETEILTRQPRLRESD